MEWWTDGISSGRRRISRPGQLTAPARTDILSRMTKVEEIKAAIDRLSFQERCELNALLNPLPDDEWDKQMRADSEPGGKLHKLMLKAKAEAARCDLRDFPKLQTE